jgi:hypothetical protein
MGGLFIQINAKNAKERGIIYPITVDMYFSCIHNK